MTFYRCDRCKMESTENKLKSYSDYVLNIFTNKPVRENGSHGFEICYDCIQKLKEFLKNADSKE